MKKKERFIYLFYLSMLKKLGIKVGKKGIKFCCVDIGRNNLVFLALIFGFFLSAFLIFSLPSAISGSADCWQYRGENGGTNASCVAAGCVWMAAGQDMCMQGSSGCCMPNGCWQYDGNQAICTNSTIHPSLNCSWDPFMKMYSPVNGSLLKTGGCMDNWGAGGGGGGVVSDGCWNFDADKSGCFANSKCVWKPNNANQNPQCWIKTFGDAKNKKSTATSDDIGCCEQKGCWSYDGNSTECNAAFNGLCTYDSNGGWCYQKWCGEITTQANCTFAATTLFMPCEWSGGVCQERSGGGMNLYNTSDSCLTTGGWWNASGSCVMPSMAGGGIGGGGGFMFAEAPKCWFADNQPSVCRNITGCVYCSDATTQISNASSACYGASVGFCKGHEALYSNWNGSFINITDISTDSLGCTHIQVKSACLYGPLPFCAWKNSSASSGAFCNISTSSVSKSAPPVKFCEDPLAKNNATLCAELASNYMMPCKWDNSTLPTKNCTFNMNAVFGGGGGGGNFDYNLIGSESSCVAGGGTWKAEYYEDGGSIKSDSWCEKGALFSATSGTAFANKGSCNDDCWACEFQANGTTWVDEANATAACRGSAKGICKWKSDSNAPNRQGYCDYPKELMYGGAKDCNLDCKACEFKGISQAEATAACSGSPIGCSWVNDTSAPNGKNGYCMAASKKSCSTDCFSCYEQSTCSNATLGQHPSFNCSWDSSMKLCKPSGHSGEICFNGIDDDNNNLIDCGDPTCTYDQFCGGGSIGSGSSDCKRSSSAAACRNIVSPGGKNCTWVTPAWGGMSYCDYPGSSCWMFETNGSACTTGIGCGWRNATSTPPYTGRCDINKSATTACFSPTSNFNATNCETNSQCRWVNDSMNFNGGRCEFKLFSSCHAAMNNASCSAVGNCTWKQFGFGGGSCEPICFAQSMSNATNCENATITGGLCSYQGTACEPEGFSFFGGSGGGGGGGFGGGGSGCGQYGGNRTGCILQNMTCMWKTFQEGNITSNAGACVPKGEGMMMQGMDMSPPKILGRDGPDMGIPAEIDIKEFGVKDDTDSLSFGIIVRNITNAAVCNGYPIGMGMGGMGQMPTSGNGSTTTKYYWYLDTNKNTTDGCRAIMNATSDETGYEFLMKYAVSLSGSVSESKFFYMCSGGSWVLTNVPLTSNRQMMCGISMPMPGDSSVGGVMLMVDKENLESFSIYNKSTPIRVRVSSANATYDETNPQDSPSTAGYYTSGTADFKFVDCGDPANKNDEKCKHFNKFGFNVFEDCKNGIDDDSDGSTDCSDMKCTFTPMCASAGQAFNFVVDENDHETPSVMFSQVDSTYGGANIKFDSNEPSNGTVSFYGNDSTCNTNASAPIVDIGDPAATFDDYKPFHMVSLDSSTLGGYNSGSGLANGTIYYYKTALCDPSGNCAMSACQNLTTQASDKQFVFKMKLPPGFNVTINGGGGWSYSGNFTMNISAGVVRDVGQKINSTVGRNMNVSINCGNQSLTFVGVDLTKPKSIDMSGAFVCDTNSTSNILGMNSSSKSWNQAVSDLGLGGANDYIRLQFPISYDSANNITWCNDELSNCTRVNNYANCSSGGTSKTNCNIPTSLGFSVYQVAVVTAASSTPAAASSSSGGGGGGGGVTAKVYSITNAQLSSGYSAPLKTGEKVQFTAFDNKNHSVTLSKLDASSSSVTIVVASTPQTVVMKAGETKKFEMTGDNVYDLQVSVGTITTSNATVTLKAISEPITSAVRTPDTTTPEATPESEDVPAGDGPEILPVDGKKTSMWVWMVVVVIVVVIVILLATIFRKKKKFKGY